MTGDWYRRHLQPLGRELRSRLASPTAAILAITGHRLPLETTPVLRRSIDVRNPYVDPINLVQIELLRRLRLAQDAPELLRAFAVTVSGVAAGMRIQDENPANSTISLGHVAFGFAFRILIANHRVHLNIGGGAIVVTKEGDRRSRSTVMVRVEDVDAHYERTRTLGARILDRPPASHSASVNTRWKTWEHNTGASRSPLRTLTRSNGERNRVNCRRFDNV